MAFSGVVRSPVYVQVAAQLREAILAGELPAGSALPAERELCERFEVSRTSIREALRALQAQGLVIAAGPTAPLRVADAAAMSSGPVRDGLVHLLRLGGVGVSDLVELRCAIEAAALEAAATRTPRPDLAAAEGAVEAMHAAGADLEAYEEADVAFHLALVTASGNAALDLVMLAARDAIASHLLDALRATSDPRGVLRKLTVEHEAILAAVREGDGPEAAALVRDHVRALYRRSRR